MLRFWGWFGAGLAIVLMLMCYPAKAADQSRLIAGGDYNFPPFEFLENENNKPSGFNIDLIKAVAKASNLEIEIRLGHWSKVKQDLREGEIDIITGMVYSVERGKVFDFSVPHTMIFPGLYVRNDSIIEEFGDITGKEIIVQEDDIMHEYLKETPMDVKIVTVQTLPEGLKLLASGHHDAALLSSEVHKYYIDGKAAFGNLREVRLDLPPQNYCFAVAEGNRTLLHEINKGLIVLKANGQYQKIYNKWFGVYEKETWWQTIKYYLFALAFIVAFFIASLVWSWSLKRVVRIQTAELRSSEEELRRAHGQLEQRVAERTLDLAQANDQLTSEINERKRIEVALRESEEEYRAIVDAFDGQIYICSADNEIKFMNKTLIERTGRDATGEKCYEALHDRDSVCPWCINDRVLQGETVRWEIQSPKDNRWYYVINTPIHHADGSISKQAMIHDITERVESEREKQDLELKNRQLQKVESLDRMAGAIAHHFNNKLHVVQGHLELALRDLPSDNKITQALNDAMLAAEKAAEVSRLMLTYLGKTTGKRAPIDLSDICNISISSIRPAIPENISLETELLSPGPAIKANANQLQLILTHLTGNSCEAIGDKKGTIKVTVKKVSSTSIPQTHMFPLNWQPENLEYGCLEVQDSGCGLAEKEIEAAFDPFYSTKFTGRGLGLSVVLGLVQAHGGVVCVESQMDHGSIFSIFIPISEEKVIHEQERKIDNRVLPEVGTVLLVDDDKIVLAITGEMLAMMGFTVLNAKDGIEALEVFQQHQDKINFVLTDFAMPRMNGLEMLTYLREIAPEVPVILASGYSEEQVLDSSHPESPQYFLEKPYSVEELRTAIGSSLSAFR